MIEFPNEINFMILNHLDNREAEGVARVCKLWRFLVNCMPKVIEDRQFVEQCYNEMLAKFEFYTDAFSSDNTYSLFFNPHYKEDNSIPPFKLIRADADPSTETDSKYFPIMRYHCVMSKRLYYRDEMAYKSHLKVSLLSSNDRLLSVINKLESKFPQLQLELNNIYQQLVHKRIKEKPCILS